MRGSGNESAGQRIRPNVCVRGSFAILGGHRHSSLDGPHARPPFQIAREGLSSQRDSILLRVLEHVAERFRQGSGHLGRLDPPPDDENGLRCDFLLRNGIRHVVFLWPPVVVSVKQVDAWADTVDNLRVVDCMRRAGSSRKTARSIGAGRYPEALSKRPAERLVALEAAGQRDIQHRILSGQQQGRRASKPEPQCKLLGRFAAGRGKHPMQMKSGKPRLLGQRREREVFVQVRRRVSEDRLHLLQRRCHVH